MATGLNGLANYLKDAQLPGFRAIPYHEPKTDSLIYYFRDEPSKSKRVNKYLTIFVADSDESLVGFEIKGLKTILNLATRLGELKLNDPPVRVNLEGVEDEVELSLLVRCALAFEPEQDVSGNHYEQLSRRTKSVRLNRKEFCTC